MKLLLDTHTILWFLSDSPQLSKKAHEAIISADLVHWSMLSIWELSIKQALPKRRNFTLPPHWETIIPRALEENQMKPLSISTAHCARVARLPHFHGDPFDRMLIAKAQCEDLTLVSRDHVFHDYQVRLLW